MIPWMLKSRLSDADDEPLPVLRPFSALRGSDVTVLIRCYPHLILLSVWQLGTYWVYSSPPVVYSQHDIILVAMSDVNQAVHVRRDLEL